MDIKHMKYFVEVVNQHGMTNASKSLYIAQPTISKAIKDIEKELNMPLFDRSNRQLVLTDAGMVFYQKCKEILALYKDLPREINSLVGLETGHISIGLSAVMNMNKFIHILGEFHQQYPNVTYNLVENGGKMIEHQLINDEIDIGITTLPVDQSIFHSLPLYQEELKLVLNQEHHLANYQKVQMAMLKDEDFILFNEDFYLNDKIIEAAKNAGYIPNTVSKISQWNFIENLLNAHLGVSILPENIVNLLDSNFKNITLEDPGMRWELGVIWKRDKYLSYATRQWIDFMKQRL
ncbi:MULTISPECIES: cidABC operon transcriptional activator CidR [Staphylococcus]|jgi:DNA-binding transcriptional LysR family regulator|uniref:cidABC operon transcriptional activator CidR n=1 Tax=Staphylococcus TaxID=1279 RepID=UPI000E05E589|nr:MULTISPECIES: LysR family transcriptional regulator [Staphylococcus]MBO1205511.1 LysR family transcriptional regulator [Staphylococcus nepalensis]MBO1220976.1 LysR family transcriptional regulator [Staphylococcus nepalensis]MCD8891980.1 LysR family transcriptional regulator [Staphylococcus nepalensis]MDR5649238.1 LysR substrate-binding domain-containing protein [Staphylococcus nepalensis]MDW8552507.1 LysR substrate-binding domain-containing protein [Staphylococcus nepalensis]